MNPPTLPQHVTGHPGGWPHLPGKRAFLPYRAIRPQITNHVCQLSRRPARLTSGKLARDSRENGPLEMVDRNRRTANRHSLVVRQADRKYRHAPRQPVFPYPHQPPALTRTSLRHATDALRYPVAKYRPMPISPSPSLYLKIGNCGWSPAAPHCTSGSALPPINASARSSEKFAKQTNYVWQYSPSAHDGNTDKIRNVASLFTGKGHPHPLAHGRRPAGLPVHQTGG